MGPKALAPALLTGLQSRARAPRAPVAFKPRLGRRRRSTSRCLRPPAPSPAFSRRRSTSRSSPTSAPHPRRSRARAASEIDLLAASQRRRQVF